MSDDDTMCWRVQVYWRGEDGSLWATGGDVSFPAGTDWAAAIQSVAVMRGVSGYPLHHVEAEVLS